MQQFKSLFKKEFNAYFKGYFAYFLFFAYVLTSFGAAFFVKDFLLAKDSALLSLFAAQPYILAVFIPAVTMKLWSEEYKQNSAEFLLTLPIEINKIILAKFCAALAFASIFTVGLLPFVLYSVHWLKIDFLNIFCSFIGLELILFLFCSLGLMFSSLSKSLVVSYSLSILTFLMSVIIPQTDFIATYHDFLFAEIGLFDIFYFISFALLFLFFTKMIVEYRRKAHKIHSLIAFSFILIALIANSLLCWAVSIFDYKIDFTAKRIYTLSSQSKDVVQRIKKPLEINLYIAEDYLQNDYAIAYYFEQVSRFLKKYKNLSKGLIKFNTYKTAAFSDEETMLIQKGLHAHNNGKGSKNYFGALLKDHDNNEEVITAFLPERQSYLEEDIDRALLKISSPKLKKQIGIYLDPEQNLDDYEGMVFIFENEYNTDLLDNASYQINKNAAGVVLINPKIISPALMYALDQYVINGGNLVVFVDKKSENQLDSINEQPIFIEKLLNNWGIWLSDNSFDKGTVFGEFSESPYPLNIKSACDIQTNSEDLQITPLIKNHKAMIGAIVQGQFRSYYNENPFAETQIGSLMRPFKRRANVGRVAVICDADILDEKNWIEKRSPDRDIYSAIEKAGNGRFVMSLIDNVAGNYIYAKLPKNYELKNILSISEMIKNQIEQSTAETYNDLQDAAESLLQTVWQLSDYDRNNIESVMNFTDVGRELQNLNNQIAVVEYQRSEQYGRITNRLILTIMIVFPLAETFFLYIIAFILVYRKNKKIKEIINEQ